MPTCGFGALSKIASDRVAPLGHGLRCLLLAATTLVPLLPAGARAQAGANLTPPGAMPGQGLQAGAAAAGQAANPLINMPSPRPASLTTAPAGSPSAAPPVATLPGGETPAGPAPQRADAVSVLMQQANFWHAQNQPQRALESVNRALTIAPNNTDGLAMLAQLQADEGNVAAANTALNRLRSVSPNDPRVALVERQLRIGPISPAALAEARRLSQEGRNADSVQRYQQILKNNPPPETLANEYYQTLAGTEGGWERARDGLAQRVRENPRDLNAQLAYAEILTYREGARAEGIARLQLLSQNPAVADAATRAWAQALRWLPIQHSSIPALSDYLRAHPNDNAVQRQLELSRNPPKTGPTDAAGEARVGGFHDLNTRNLAGAERGFNEALALNPNDADALGGLGLVRLRQGRIAEGRNLLNRAIAADPSRRGQWLPALNGLNTPNEYGTIRALAERGDYSGAERQIRAAMAHGGGPGLMAMLADVQARRGDLPAAEGSYRAALARAPNDAGVMVGLAGVLQQEGRSAEAQDLLNQAGTRGQGALRLIGQARAEQLRDQARDVSDPATQEGLYRAAMAADPNNPWVRLDLARLLARRGRLQEARSLMADVTSGPRPTADDLQAGIIFANENRLTTDAIALVDRVPARARTAEMRAVLAQAQVNRDIEADLLFPAPVAREKLLALAAAGPDPDGSRGAAIARALNRMGDPQEARAAIATAQTVTRTPSAEAQVNYAAALLDIGDTADAQAMLRNLPGGGLTPAQRLSANRLGAGIAVRTADTLNQAGRQADAYDSLAPALARTPDNPDLNMALARLYEGADKPKQALEINLSVLQRDPTNMVARKAAVDAAIAAGNRTLADQLVREGLEKFPNDPRSWMTSADLARARGNNLRALQDLQRAKQLRQQQMGGSDNGADGAPAETGLPAPPASSESTHVAPLLVAQAGPPPDFNRPGLAPSPYMPAPYNPAQVPTYSAPPSYAPPTYTPAPNPLYPAGSSPAVTGYQTQVPSGNPFRSSASPFGSTTLPTGPEDPMTAEIDRSIAALRDQVAPSIQAGTLLRARSGTAGLDRLLEAALPLEATFSPGGYGQMRLLVQPTYLGAGTLGGDPFTQARFGQQALAVTPPAAPGLPPGFNGRLPGSQYAQGVGLDLAYRYNWLSADIGTTPLGFRVNNVIGGVEVAPQLSNNATLRVTGERRAVTDSLLSYGGQRDPQSGQNFGGVTSTRGYAQLELKAGLANFYLGGGFAALAGQHVVHNTEAQAGAGGSYPVWRDATDELRVGLDLVYFGFNKNLSNFSFGDGGYFSPQSYFAALIPVSYTSKAIQNLSYTVGGSVGFQVFNENSSPYFPGNPALQSALVTQAAAVPGLQTSYPSKTSAGVAGGLNARAEYSLSPSLKVGARASYQHAGDYDEGEGLIYARYIFNGAE